MSIGVLIPDLSDADLLGDLPSGVVVGDQPAPDVQFMVAASAPGVIPTIAAAFAALPSLRVVQSVNAGTEWLVPRAPKGLLVCSARGVHDSAVSEWVIAATLGSRRRFPELRDAQNRGEWDGLAQRPVNELPADLDGARVLIVGFGSIGRAVGRRLAPFGCDVVGVVTHARDDLHGVDELPDLLPGADVVITIDPLTDQTLHQVDADFLSRMKRGATLVNASRGPIVDTDALLDALRAGHVRAALDVTDPEPLPPDHPLWSAPGVTITPHVAGATHQWKSRAYAFAGEQITRFVAGDALQNVVSEPQEDQR